MTLSRCRLPTAWVARAWRRRSLRTQGVGSYSGVIHA